MSAAPEITEDHKRQSLLKIIKASQTAFFVTESGGALHGRPMANAKVEDDLSAIWFAAQRQSGKIAELREDHKILLGYTNSSGSEWASVNGSALMVDDRARVKAMWNPFWKNWFDGPDDPNILLIRVLPKEAEYWDSGSRAITMVKFALAAVTGKRFDEGENERVRL